MVVYGDLYFAINLTVDFLLLWMTGAWIGEKPHPWRVLAGALIGAVYAFGLSLVPQLAWWGWLPLRLLFPLAMLAAAYGLRGSRRALRLVGVFYGVSLVAGGAALASQFWSTPGGWLPRGLFVLRQYNLIVPAVLGSLGLGRQVFRLVQHALSESRRYYPVEVAFGERRVRLRALLDTGNHLRDPVLQVPVMVVDYEGLAPCLPEAVRRAFEVGIDDGPVPVGGMPRVDPEALLDALDGTPWASRLRLIPFSSVGRRGGMLVGFRPDAVYYWDGERMVAATQALVGIYSHRLDEAGRYNALLSPDILTTA